MASLGIRCGGNGLFVQSPSARSSIDRSNLISQFRHSLSIRNQATHRTSASMATSDSSIRFDNSVPTSITLQDEYEKFRNKKIAFSETLDEWVRDSVVEIVKNLNQAPLLVHVYANANANGSVMLKTEKADTENWPIVEREWKIGETPCPDGIIFVEALEDNRRSDDDAHESSSRLWGLVIQGKAAECGPVCYLLKTSRAAVGPGLGLFCTHFCLVRVNSFRESALSQLTHCWLL